MTATRAIGLVCLVIGLVALVGGGVYAIMGYNDSDSGGWFSSGDDHDESQMNNGFFVGGLGLLLTILGVVLMAVGRAGPRGA